MRATTAILLAAASIASAHFTLSHPSALGNAAKQGTAPCGGHSITAGTAAQDFYVSSDFISLKSSHPESRWTFSLTEDFTAGDASTPGDDAEWTAIQAPVAQSGLGELCTPVGGDVLEEWVGKKAILQVKEDKSDGKLYSCAYVNLIEGSRPGAPEGCTNSTGVSASLETSDDDAEPSSTETESDATPSPTESEAEDTATPTGAASSKSAIGAAVVGGAAVVAALML